MKQNSPCDYSPSYPVASSKNLSEMLFVASRQNLSEMCLWLCVFQLALLEFYFPCVLPRGGEITSLVQWRPFSSCLFSYGTSPPWVVFGGFVFDGFADPRTRCQLEQFFLLVFDFAFEGGRVERGVMFLEAAFCCPVD